MSGFIPVAQAQGGNLSTNKLTGVDTDLHALGGSGLEVTVLNEKHKPLDRQAVIKLQGGGNPLPTWRATGSDAVAVFPDLTLGGYKIEVSAVGYEPLTKEIQVADARHATREEITLHPDPNAVDLNAAQEALPAKVKKQIKRATADLKSGHAKEAAKALNAAQQMAPTSATVLFLQGYLATQTNDLRGAKIYLTKSVSLSPHNAPVLELLGKVQLQLSEYDEAQKSLERATAVAPNRALTHSLLGSAYLYNHQYEKALSEGQTALQLTNGKLNSGNAVVGQACAALGKKQRAIDSLNDFLNQAANDPMSPQVKELLARVEQSDDAVPVTAAPVLAAEDTNISPAPWQPPSIDDVRMPVAAGVSCPLGQVLSLSGQHMEEFVEDVSKFAAIEDLLHERIDKAGYPVSKETRKFDYIASISEPTPGSLAVEEFRTGRYQVDDLPDRIRTNGFPALALIFHPEMRDNFEMSCEGLGQWNGQATWLVRFQQREDKPKRLQAYIVNGTVYPVEMKGRAWISADKFQIVRIESELIKPIPQILLGSEHQITEYGPVDFPSKKTQLWLPKQAEVYLDFQKRFYYRKHSFDHYMLFSVDAEEKRKEAKHETSPTSVSPEARKKGKQVAAVEGTPEQSSTGSD